MEFLFLMQDFMDTESQSLIKSCFKLHCTNTDCRFAGVFSQWYTMICPLCKNRLEQPQEKTDVSTTK